MKRVNIMKHMSIYGYNNIFLKTLGSSCKCLPELVAFLLFLSTHVSSQLGSCKMSLTTLIFSRTITVNKMKLLIVRSTIAVQNMLCIAIYIYVLEQGSVISE